MLTLAALLPCAAAAAQSKPSPLAQSSPIQVSTDGQTDPSRYPNSGPFTSTPFVVTNVGPTPVSGIRLSCRSTGSIAPNCAISAPGWTGDLDAGASATVYVIYSTTSVPQLSSVGVQAYVIETRQLSGNDKFFSVVLPPPPAAPAVALRNENDSVQSRSRCLTLGAGEAAAWQCGELLVSHSLPGYRTLNKERALTLVYSTAQASPTPIAAAAVTEGGNTIARPDTIVAELQVNTTGTTWLSAHTASYTPWGNPGGQLLAETRQVALSWDAHGSASGSYPFRLIVTNRYNGGPSYADTIGGQFLVNNRASSSYGAGWWPAGVEQLAILSGTGGPVALYGADGSVKLFQPGSAPSGQTRWVGAAEAFPDTLIQDNASQRYSRTLRHGIKIVYDAAGRHIQTINRIGDTTFISYNGNGSISTIRVPPSNQPSGTTYAFAYNATTGLLQSITDPAGRVLSATMAGGQLTSLKDPDLVSTGFAYDASNRLSGRTSRRAATAHYSYASGRLTRFAIPFGTGAADSGITAVRPWEFVGLNGAAADVLDSSYTRVDGPRSDVADVAKVWVDRWGAPTRMVDPNGAQTQVSRGSGTAPALATHIVRPNGAVDSLVYDARGNLTDMQNITTGLSGALPTAVSHWGYGAPTAPDSPDTIIDPAGLKTFYSYNQWGLTSLVTAPNGHQTRFDYITTPGSPLLGLVQGVAELGMHTFADSTNPRGLINNAELREGFAFNALGNVVADTSPTKHVQQYLLDLYQRVQHHYDAAGHHTEFTYDALNRTTVVTQHVEEGNPVDPTLHAPVSVRYYYGAGPIDSVRDARTVGHAYRYDLAGRLIAEIDDMGTADGVPVDTALAHTDSTYYDPAGHVSAAKARRGFRVQSTYDAGGRLIQRSWPVGDSSSVGNIRYGYPDTLRLGYDVMGDVTSLRTNGKTILRSYYANGALLSERDTSAHISQAYGVDQAGRRTWHRLGPPNDAAHSDSIMYNYASTGVLHSLSVRWRPSGGLSTPSDSVLFVWDGLGRRDTLRYSNGVLVAYGYDGDGLLRLLCSTHNVSFAATSDVFKFHVVHDSVDRDQNILASNRIGTPVSGCSLVNSQSQTGLNNISMSYDNRHQLLRQLTGPVEHSYRYDASGNRIFDGATTGDTLDEVVYTQRNRLLTQFARRDATMRAYGYWTDGSRWREDFCPLSDSLTCGHGSLPGGSREYFYDALGRVIRILGTPPTSADATCAYDPAGRMQIPCSDAPVVLGFDGENVVRTGGDSATTYTWSFVHGPGTDDVLLGHYTDATTLRAYFITDGLGRQLAVGDSAGHDLTNSSSSGSNAYLNQGGKYAGGTTSGGSFGASRSSNNFIPTLSFFRNRVYDQATARWTQEDPIGIAGGVNLYGFNANNPSAYSDPFGLCPPQDPTTPCTGQDLIDQVAGRVKGLQTVVVAGGALELAPLVVAAGAELVAGSGTVALNLGSKAASATLSNGERALLREFFGQGINGAQERAADFKLPDGLTREALDKYARVARRAIARGADKTGVQAERLKLIERAVKTLE